MLINKDNYHDAMKQLFSGRTKLQLIKDDPFTRLKAVPNYLNNLWKPTRQQELERRLYGPVTSQVHPKRNTQWRIDGTSPRSLSGTSPRRLQRR